MTQTIYALALTFTTHQACWQWVHDHGLHPLPANAEIICREVDVDPRWTVRPKARSWSDEEGETK